MRRLAAVGVFLLATVPPALGSAGAAEGEARVFGLVDLSSQRAPETLRVEVERWASTRGLTTLADQGMRRALSGPEPARLTIGHLVSVVRNKQSAGDCAAALTLAGEAEAIALGGLGVDEEREPLKNLYATLIECEDRLGHADQARAAGARLRALVSMVPAPLSQELWDRYAATPADTAAAAPATVAPAPAAAAPPADTAAAAPATVAPAPAAAAPPPATVELQIDSDPPNARVAINFHFDGVTPRTLKVPPGVIYVELEKEGYKKAFRKVTVGRAPVRTDFALEDRRQDRAAQVEGTVARLRGGDPERHRTTLARLAELARVDVLVAIAVNADTLRMWWFDAERGDLVGAPVESRLDPKTGRWVNAASTLGQTN